MYGQETVGVWPDIVGVWTGDRGCMAGHRGCMDRRPWVYGGHRYNQS